MPGGVRDRLPRSRVPSASLWDGASRYPGPRVSTALAGRIAGRPGRDVESPDAADGVLVAERLSGQTNSTRNVCLAWLAASR